jgi:TonB family protein
MGIRLLGTVLFVFLAFTPQQFIATNPQAHAGVSAERNLPGWLLSRRIAPVPGLPFTAKVEIESVFEGPSFSHKEINKTILARDSAGRTRSEASNFVSTARGFNVGLARIEIVDPVANETISLIPQRKLAMKRAVSGEIFLRSSELRLSELEAHYQDLGTDTMLGFPVRGVRLHESIAPNLLDPTQTRIVVTEYWYSEDLKLSLLTKRTELNANSWTMRIKSIQRNEPDTSLFTIPEDYKVQEMMFGTSQTDTLSPRFIQPGSSPETSTLPHNIVATQPTCRYCPSPEYPEEAAKANLRGEVFVQILVNEDGIVENAEVVQGLGTGLDEVAVKGVKQWRFNPALDRQGNPVSTITTVAVTFAPL